MINLIFKILPIFASAAAAFFVVFYLTREKAIASIFQKSMEYIFLFIVSGVVIFPFSHLHLSSLGSSEKGLLSGLLLLMVYVVVLVLLRTRLKQILVNIVLLFQQKYLGLYLGLVVFSSFWSPTPLLSFRGAFALLMISSFAVHFAREYNWQQNFQLFRYSQAVIAIFSIFMAFFVPSEGLTEKGWAGGIGHPIELGNMMALAASFWLLSAIQNRKQIFISLPICMLCIAIMQLANSAGAFVVFLSLAVIVFVLPIFRRLNFLQANFLFTFILLFFSVPTIWLLSSFEQTTSLFGKDTTFTGRIPLWSFLIEQKIPDHLWFGHGYSGFWQSWQGSENPAVSVSRLVGDWAVHAHNGFIDIILNLGLVGFVLFILSFLVNIGRAIKLLFNSRSYESIIPLMILTFVFISNLSQTSIVFPGYIWFLYVVVTAKLQIEYLHNKKTKYRRVSNNNFASP